MGETAKAGRTLASPAWACALLALLGSALFVRRAWLATGRLGLPLDDSWIHLQFARNLARGAGLAFEPGELVAASTAPLWTALLALLAPLPGSAVGWAQGLGAVLFAVGAVVFHSLCRDLGLGRGTSLFAALLFVFTGPLTWGAVSGMEISLFVLLSLTGVRLHLSDRGQRRGVALSLPVLGLAALARPEGLLLLGLAVVDRLLVTGTTPREAWRGAWPGLLLASCVVAPVALFNLAASGSPLPTTFAAKSGGPRGWLPDLRYLDTVFGILFRSQPWATVLAGAGAVLLVLRRGSPRDRGLLPALWLFALPLAFSCLGSASGPLVGNFGRYLYPLLPFVILLGCVGIGEVVRRRVVPRWAYPLAALLIAWPTIGHWSTSGEQFARNVANVEEGDVAAALWLRDRLPDGATLAVNDIGALKYHLPEHRIYDLAGIVSPEVHRFTRRAVAAGRPWEEGVLGYLARTRPDYLVVFPDWFPRLVASGVSFEPVRELPVTANITLGGDRLVIYRTPWTRREMRR